MAPDFSNAKISVFWDMDDFPNPNGGSLYEIVKSALENEGFHGDVSIKAYGEKKPDEDLDGVTDFIPKRTKYARLTKMLIDIAFWQVDNPRHGNLMVIAKNIPEDTDFEGFFNVMVMNHYNLFIVVPRDCVPEEIPIPSARSMWFWESFLDGAKPIDPAHQRSLLARVKPDTFGSEYHVAWEDDGIPCPCGWCDA